MEASSSLERMVALAVCGLTDMDKQDDEIKFTVELSLDEIRQLAESVQFHWRNWPGSPAAPIEEQEMLLHLKGLLRMALLEVAFHRPTQSR